MRINRFVAWIVIVALASVGAASAGEAPGSDEGQLRHLKEVRWPKAYAERNIELFDEILADESQMIDRDGTWRTVASHVSGIERTDG